MIELNTSDFNGVVNHLVELLDEVHQDGVVESTLATLVNGFDCDLTVARAAVALAAEFGHWMPLIPGRTIGEYLDSVIMDTPIRLQLNIPARWDAAYGRCDSRLDEGLQWNDTIDLHELAEVWRMPLPRVREGIAGLARWPEYLLLGDPQREDVIRIRCNEALTPSALDYPDSGPPLSAKELATIFFDGYWPTKEVADEPDLIILEKTLDLRLLANNPDSEIELDLIRSALREMLAEPVFELIGGDVDHDLVLEIRSTENPQEW